MSEGLIDLLAQSETAHVAILFKDQGDRTRISVRTRDGGVDATRLTGAFGGGGHARAAGATLEEPIATARPHGARRRSSAHRGAAGAREAARGTTRALPDGVLVVDKPMGPTSHDVVALVRRLTGVRRVGHGGTLDPFARGVLPVFIGRATRMVEYHLADDKAYRATVAFGATSTTDDLDGELTAVDGPAARARRRGGGARAVRAARSSRCRRTTRPSTSPAGARTSSRAAATSPSCGRGP